MSKKPTEEEIARVTAWQEEQRVKRMEETAIEFYENRYFPEPIFLGMLLHTEMDPKVLIGAIKGLLHERKRT